jgi:hypothetical protein
MRIMIAAGGEKSMRRGTKIFEPGYNFLRVRAARGPIAV